MPANCFPPTVHEFIYLPRVFPSSADHRRFLGGSPTLSRGDDLFEFLSRRGGNSPREVVDRLRDILRGTNLTIQRLRFTRRPRSRDREVQRNRFDCWHTFDSDEDSSSVFFFDCLVRLIAASETIFIASIRVVRNVTMRRESGYL